MGAAVAGLGRIILPAGIGYGAYGVAKAGFTTAGNYNQMITQISAMGYGKDVIGMATKYAETPTRGISPTTKMKSFISALMATQSPKMAQQLAPTIAAGTLAGSRIFGDISYSQMKDAIRTAETMGGSDPKKIANALSSVLMAYAVSGGTLPPSQQRQMVNRNPYYSPLGFLSMEPVAQQIGGNRVGTGMRTGIGAMMQGNVPMRQGRTWQQYGWTAPISYNTLGMTLGSKFGAFKNIDLARADPFKFLKDIIKPTYAKRGWTSEKEIGKHILFDFPRTYADILLVQLKDFAKIERLRARAGNIPGIEGYKTLGAPEKKATQKLSEAWNTFTLGLGKFADPAVDRGMTFLANLFESLGNSLNRQSKINQGISRVSGGGWRAFFMPWIAASKSDAELMGDVTSPAPSSSNNGAGIKGVYLDSHRVGDIMFGHNSGNQMVSSGALSILPAYHGLPNSSNILGGGFQPMSLFTPTLTLGPITFTTYEIPAHINFGGMQALSVKQLVGGQRIVDAMGVVQDDITWSGIFFGTTALFRARFLDGLRSQGLALPLTWSQFSYSVVIKDFKASYERDYQIPYSITVSVIQDLTIPIPILIPASYNDSVQVLLAQANDLALIAQNANVSTALLALNLAVNAIPDIGLATAQQLATVVAPLLQAQTVVASAIVTTANMIAGQPNNVIASNMEILYSLYSIQSVLQEIYDNLALISEGSQGVVLTVKNLSLFALAAKYYGDATSWTVIAIANGLTDPMVLQEITLTIPQTAVTTGGILNAQ